MTTIIFQSLGGLGLFLFGMKIMSEGLQKVAREQDAPDFGHGLQ